MNDDLPWSYVLWADALAKAVASRNTYWIDSARCTTMRVDLEHPDRIEVFWNVTPPTGRIYTVRCPLPRSVFDGPPDAVVDAVRDVFLEIPAVKRRVA